MLRRLLVAAAVAAVVAVVLVPLAGAAPTNAKNSTLITASCGGRPVTVVVIGNGEFSPAHDTSSTSVFIPTAFDTTFTFTPSGGGSPDVEHDTSAKAAPIANTVTCFFTPR
jgi:hypothetical protein